ncbi:phage tail tape measure protein [Bernardetia sp.]|uniref:phage tail tape measure protein n=1 Tax=Bernardetia sp. TaxID=1937974 RepID=UPI0025BD5B85|nr:phage tail tape measure protein [Bernardetia sp.]
MAKTSKDSIQIDVEINGLKAGKTLKELQNQKRTLNKELRNLTIGTEEYRKKAEQLTGINKIYAEQQQKIKGVNQELKTKGGFLGKVKGAIAPLGAAMAGAFAISVVADWTMELWKGIEATNKLRQEVSQLTGLQGKELDNLTVKISSLSKTTGEEQKELMLASNAFAKQMGISHDEAFQLIEKGFYNGANANGNFLELLKELPVQFRNAGYSAEQTIKVMTQEVKGGVFNGTLSNTVKEMTLALTEMTKAQKDALTNAFGSSFTNELEKGLNTGELTVKDAYEKIKTEGEKLGLSTQQIATITADVFKGAGEDAGGYQEIVKQLDAAMNINLDTLDDYGKKQKAANEATQESEAALNELSKSFTNSGSTATILFNKALTFLYKTLDKAVEIFGALSDKGEVLFKKLFDIGKTLGLVSEQTDTMGMAMQVVEKVLIFLVQNVSFLIEGLIFLSDGFKAAYEGGGLFRTVVDGVIEGVKSLVGWIADAIDFVSKLSGTEEAIAKQREQRRKADAEQAKKDAADALKKKEQEEKAKTETEKKAQEDRKKQAVAANRQKNQEVAKEDEKMRLENEKRKIQLIQDETERSIKSAQFAAEQEKKAIEKSKVSAQTKAESIKLIEQQLANDIAAIRKTAQEKEEERQKEEQEKAIENAQIKREEEKRDRILGATNAVTSAENTGDAQAILDAKIAQAELEREIELEQLDLTENEKFLIEQEYQQKKLDAQQEFEDKKKAIQQAGWDFSKELVGGTADLLQQAAEQNKKFGSLYKVAAISDIGINLAQEVQAIWKNANANPLNAIIPGAGTAIAIGKTALATGRAGFAVAKVKAQNFFDGGFTGPGEYKDETGHRVAGVVHDNEYVSPKWMVQRYPNLFASMENIRLRGFADGGFTSTTPSIPTDSVNPTQNNDNQKMMMMLGNTLNRLNQNLDVGIQAQVNPNDINKYNTDLNYIQNRASFS